MEGADRSVKLLLDSVLERALLAHYLGHLLYQEHLGLERVRQYLVFLHHLEDALPKTFLDVQSLLDAYRRKEDPNRVIARTLRSEDKDLWLRLAEADICEGVEVLFWGEEAYPASLKSIPHPPVLLFLKGQREALLNPIPRLCVVGTRRPSAYAKWIAERELRYLAREGCALVSGLAIGVDALAHRAALEVGQQTLAVLAHGLDQVYPSQNRRLAVEVAQQGCLMSEYPRGYRARRYHFVQRNRLMSGVADLCLVVEAHVRSGTSATVDHALEQGKDVYAVPGSIYSPESLGPNRLLSQGAHVFLSGEQLLEDIRQMGVGSKLHNVEPAPIRGDKIEKRERQERKIRQSPSESHLERQILEYLRFRAWDVWELQRSLNIDEHTLLFCLHELEKRHLVLCHMGRYQAF